MRLVCANVANSLKEGPVSVFRPREKNTSGSLRLCVLHLTLTLTRWPQSYRTKQLVYRRLEKTWMPGPAEVSTFFSPLLFMLLLSSVAIESSSWTCSICSGSVL